MIQSLYDSPIGTLVLVAREDALVRVAFSAVVGVPMGENAVLQLAKAQLAEYFSGERMNFTVPIAPEGTLFQKRVWTALAEIPYGQTETYGSLAARIGMPKASRAVGQANNRNPLPILLPCHRVIGVNGTLTGYAGGVEMKQRLLQLEKHNRAEE